MKHKFYWRNMLGLGFRWWLAFPDGRNVWLGGSGLGNAIDSAKIKFADHNR